MRISNYDYLRLLCYDLSYWFYFFGLDFDLHSNSIHNVVQKLRRNDFDASLKITRLQLFHQLSSFLHYLCKLGLANQQGIRILLVPSGSLSNIVSTQPLIRILYFYNKRQPAQFDLSDGVLRTRVNLDFCLEKYGFDLTLTDFQTRHQKIGHNFITVSEIKVIK